jgi:hypothetical protein
MKLQIGLIFFGLWNALNLSEGAMHICERDEQQFCSSLGGRIGKNLPSIVQCLQENFSQLSPDCRELLELRKFTEEGCYADMEKLSCHDDTSAHPSPLACIMQNKEASSRECQVAINRLMQELTPVVRRYVHGA